MKTTLLQSTFVPSKLFRSMTLLGAIALATASAGVGQPKPTQPAVFGEVIDVRVINLEVVVTDKGDDRVRGLTAEDFDLLVDGTPTPIEYFTEVSGGTAVEREDARDQTTVPALAPGVPVSTSYLVFIDDYFTVAARRDRILRAMIEQLPLLGPEDRMAVVAFDGKKLEMLSTWSQSVEALTRVFEHALDRQPHGLSRLAEQRAYEATHDQRRDLLAAESTLDNRLDIEERQRAAEIADQVKKVVMASASALRSFAMPPGRKVMILLSGGWPYNPSQYVVRDRRRVMITDDVPWGTDLYSPLVETANRLSYSIYPVDVPGLLVPGEGADQSNEPDLFASKFAAGSVDANGQVGSDIPALIDQDQDMELRSTLWALAGETGGRPLMGGATGAAFERVVEDTRSYYWLGFTPRWKGDDSDHKVVVRTRDRKLDVRTRQGFSDLARETEVTMMVESALLFGDTQSAEPLKVELGEGREPAGRGKVRVPMRVIIPLDSVTFLPAEKGYAAQLELRVAVRDDTGATSDIPVIPLDLSVEHLPHPGGYTIYDTGLVLRKRHHDLVVSIYDKPSGTILTGKLEVDASQRK